jgi:ribosome-associated protein
MLVVNERIQIPDDELEFTFSRSSGPGGQNVNKVNSKATLRWRVGASASLPIDVRERFLAHYGSRLTNDGDLIIASQRYRDQPGNIRDCLERLRIMLTTVAKAPRRRRKTRPTRGSVERRLETKRRSGYKKEDRGWSAGQE